MGTATQRSTTTRDRHRRVIARGKPPCALCSEPIDYALPYPHPLCFTVDHIIPIGRNPTPERLAELDVLSNKQPAHFKCNRDKWDRTDEDETPTTFVTWRTW